MSPLDGKLRVLIATTNGPVEIQLLTEEDAAIGRCVVCIGGTTETADIAGGYHAFVVRPTGVIESRFGHSCFRLDVSGRIDAGSSWQLGVLAAHALLANGRLAQESDVADGILWTTGSVRPVDLTVSAVSHVPEKLANSLARLREERAAGRAVLLAVPAANAVEVSTTIESELSALGIGLVTPAHAQALFDALAMELPAPGAHKGSLPASSLPTASVSAATPRRRYVWAAAVAALGLVAATGAALVAHRSDSALGSSRPAEAVAPASAPNSVVANPSSREATRVEIDPERVPFLSAHDRERIRGEYMSAPNYKALAMSMMKFAFVSGQPSQEAADKGAMEACEKVNAGSSDRICDLYASGTFVVTHRNSPTLPPTPWINASVMRPFDAALVPMVRQKSKDVIDKTYPRGSSIKSLVLSATGGSFITYGQSSPNDAMRRGLERCGYSHGDGCRVIAVGDTFVTAVPTLTKAVGFYRPDALFGVQPDELKEVARRLASATEGWNAVAVGTAGHVGTKVGDVSERSAVDGALTDCASHDQNCRIVVIGPFLVEPFPMRP